MIIEILTDILIRRISHLNNQTGRITMIFRGKFLITPVHKRLRNKDCIQTGRETDHLTLKLFLLTPSLDENLKLNHAHQSITDFRKRMTLGKTEIVHINIGTRQNNRNLMCPRLILPVFQRNIHKAIRNTLEEQFRVEHIHTVHAHRSIHLVFSRSKFTDFLHKLLRCNLINLTTRKTISPTTDCIPHTDFLTHDKIISLHKTILLGEHWQDILIKLKAKKDNQHTK